MTSNEPHVLYSLRVASLDPHGQALRARPAAQPV